mmetsp:Transcript_5293/g.11083  ORF Transcript_5293/g.11083 Transcript_5293/m.11083 type:complete len:235 (+) Transcript_5293:2069-2773(+)
MRSIHNIGFQLWKAEVFAQTPEGDPALYELEHSHGQKRKGKPHDVEKRHGCEGRCSAQGLPLNVDVRQENQDWLYDRRRQQYETETDGGGVGQFCEGPQFRVAQFSNLFAEGTLPGIVLDDAYSRQHLVHHLDSQVTVFEHSASLFADHSEHHNIHRHQRQHKCNSNPGGVANLTIDEVQRNYDLDRRHHGHAHELQEALHLGGVVGHHIHHLARACRGASCGADAKAFFVQER